MMVLTLTDDAAYQGLNEPEFTYMFHYVTENGKEVLTAQLARVTDRGPNVERLQMAFVPQLVDRLTQFAIADDKHGRDTIIITNSNKDACMTYSDVNDILAGDEEETRISYQPSIEPHGQAS